MMILLLMANAIAIVLGAAAMPAPSAPILAPNLSSCRLTSFVPSSLGPAYNCCAPLPSSPPTLFRLPPTSTLYPRLRLRRPAHLSTASYAANLSLAYSLMKALPDDDPRSFTQQAKIHCAYCNAVYDQTNSSLPFQSHFSWLFLPFHRWYLYFHERILASLLRDPDFTLPFWSYDHPDGCHIPDIYIRHHHLMDINRDPRHLPPAIAAINYLNYNAPPPLSRFHQLRENAAYLHRSLVRDSTSKYAFHGGPFRHGDVAGAMTGNVERYPHNTLHIWIGSVYANGTGGRDMGWFSTAGFDPLFYAHHTQIDRLWEIWLSLPGNDHIDDEDYLDTEFLFYDERAKLVRVKVRDALDLTRMGYAYQDVETPWLNAVPESLSGGILSKLSDEDEVCRMGELIERPCSVLLKRDMGAVESLMEENLMINGVNFTTGMPYILDVYLNLPTATTETPSGIQEYVNSVYSVPQFSINMTSLDSVLPLTPRVKALNLTSASELVLTFVPKGLDTGCAVMITSLSLQYSQAAA